MILVADTETTGIDPATDSLVEYAHAPVYKTEADGKWFTCANGLSTLLHPGRPIPPAASGVHHITDKMVDLAPTPEDWFGRVEFRNDLRGAEAIAFHNAQFDVGFLRRYLQVSDDGMTVCVLGRSENSRLIPVLDTWRIAVHLWPDAPDFKNQTLRYWLGVEPMRVHDAHGRGAHSAVYDVMTTAAILAKQLEQISLEEAIRLSDPNLPALQKNVRSTKYRGRPWQEMDAGFCRWILLQASPPFDVDTRHSAAYQGRWLKTPAGERPEWGKPFD